MESHQLGADGNPKSTNRRCNSITPTYTLTENEIWLELVETARGKKKIHNEKLAKRDRKKPSFFSLVSKSQCTCTCHSSTASPYIRPQTTETTNSKQTVYIISTQYGTLLYRKLTKLSTQGSPARDPKIKQKRSPKKSKHMPRPYTRSYQLCTGKPRIFEYGTTSKQKPLNRGLVLVQRNPL